MADETRKAGKITQRKQYEPPRLRQYGTLNEIVRMKGVAGQTDPIGGQPTKQTTAS